MAYQHVCKQGRDDIKVKVNIQSPIPASFYTKLLCEKDAGRRLCIFTLIPLFEKPLKFITHGRIFKQLIVVLVEVFTSIC